MTTSTTRTPLYNLWQKGLPQNRRFCGKRSRSGMSDFSRLRGNERYEVCGDESRGSAAARNGGFFHGRGFVPGEMEDLCSFLLLPLLPCKLSSWRWALALPCGAWSICWRATARITQRPMLMYGREAQSKTRIASPATIPKSGERNRKIHSCMLYLISI